MKNSQHKNKNKYDLIMDGVFILFRENSSIRIRPGTTYLIKNNCFAGSNFDVDLGFKGEKLSFWIKIKMVISLIKWWFASNERNS